MMNAPAADAAVAVKRRLVQRLLRNRLWRARGLYPASTGQKALWFLQSVMPISAAYNLNATIRVKGALDPNRFAEALNGLAKPHESLRSAFEMDDGELVRRVVPEVTLPVRITECRGWNPPALQAALEREANMPFDLSRAPLARAAIFACDSDDHVIALTVHHIIGDFWSLVLCLRELGALYDASASATSSAIAPPANAPHRGSYTDFVNEQDNLLDSPAADTLWRFWHDTLDGYSGRLALPTSAPPAAERRFTGGAVGVDVPAPTLEPLRTVAREEGTTLFVVLLAAYVMLLARCTGGNDIVVGVPMLGRDDVRYQETVGYFANLVPVRVRLEPNGTFRCLVRAVRTAVLAAMAHQALPFPLIVERLEFAGDHQGAPLVQATFMFERSQHEGQAGVLQFLAGAHAGQARLRIGELVGEPVPLRRYFAQFDLNLMLETVDGRLTGLLEYGDEAFSETTAAWITRQWTRLLTVLPGSLAPLHAIESLSPDERDTMLRQWNDTARPLPSDATVHGLFFAQAAHTGDRLALRFGDATLTYRELGAMVVTMAGRLRDAGVGPGMLVAIYLGRDPMLVVALLALLSLGAAYLPLDPDHPALRTRDILNEAQVHGVLTGTGFLTRLRLACEPWFSTDIGEALCFQRLAYSNNEPGIPDLAYVIFTSGSTGQPKGVAIRHAGVVNVLMDVARRIDLSPEDHVLASTTICFDIAMLELFMPLLHGAALVLPTAEQATDLATVLPHLGVTVMQATPSLWRLLLASGCWTGQGDLTALCGGEVLPASLARTLASRCGRLFNLYGPTETTIWSAICPIFADQTEPVPIGRPLANTQVYVLDSDLQPVPPWTEGDLYIGGAGLAVGYWRRPDLTASSFIEHPFELASGARVYRTGDRACWRDNGTLMFRGRQDTQVKVRGYRVDLAEIEDKLSHHQAVSACAMTLTEDNGAGVEVMAHVVAQGPVPADELRRYLAERLPAYAVPRHWDIGDALPLTTSGKLDRRALAARRVPLTVAVPASGSVGEISDIETELCRLWSHLLARAVGPDDDFFELGGHSLLAIQWIARAEAVLGVRPAMADVLRSRTVRTLTQNLRRQSVSAPSSGRLMLRAGSGGGTVWLIPGIGGSLPGFRHLVDNMPTDMTVLGWDTAAMWRAGATVDAAAASLVSEIASAEGPIHLLGHSFGGLLAFAAARARLDAGVRTDTVILLDTAAPLPADPAVLRQLTALRRDVAEARSMQQLRPWLLWAGLPEAVADVVDLATASLWVDQLASAFEYRPKPYAGTVVVARATAGGPVPLEHFQADWKSQHALDHCFDKQLYPPDCSSQADVALVGNSQRALPDLGWGAFCSGRLTSLDVPGDHFSTLGAAHAREMLSRILKMLEVSA